MKIVRYSTRNTQAEYGWVLNDHIGSINGNPFHQHRRLEALTPLTQVKLLAPVEPSKIIGILKNFQTGDPAQDAILPEIPSLYLKPPSTLTGHKNLVEIPPQTKSISVSAELGVVIGKQGRWIPLNNAYDHVFGYTCVINFAAVDFLQDETAANVIRAYGFDGFCAAGPWIETDMDPNDLVISAYVNNKLSRMFTTHEMVFNIPQIIAYLSTIMTLNSGDLILTGGIPIQQLPLKPKDRVMVEIQEIGRLQVELTESKR